MVSVLPCVSYFITLLFTYFWIFDAEYSAFHIVDSMNNYLLEECLVAFHVYVFLSAQLD